MMKPLKIILGFLALFNCVNTLQAVDENHQDRSSQLEQQWDEMEGGGEDCESCFIDFMSALERFLLAPFVPLNGYFCELDIPELQQN